jgi:2-polyprenyl-3-methyl-5-hydroxy-6-metoxy-1,4-benzoquinol methylase
MYQEDIAFQARLYDDPNPTRRGLHRARKAWVEVRLERYLKPHAKVLEVGVGCGLFTQFMSGMGMAVTAVDINQAFLDGVEGLPAVSVRHGDATTDLGLRDFDVGLSSEVIEHVPRERSEAMLREFLRALKPGGVLVLSTPQRFSTLELTARLLRFPPALALARRIYGSADDLGHINLLTRGQLQRQIAAAGFEIIEHEVFGLYLPAVAEFGGGIGARFLGSLGSVLAHVPILRSLLWTQGYVLRKPA